VTWPNWATDLGFVAPSALESPDIVCHRNSSNSKLYATVAAGSEVTLRWYTWPDSHKGPIIDYLAPCNGECTTVDKNSLRFFKIAQRGQVRLGAGSGKAGYVNIPRACPHSLPTPGSVPPISLRVGK
jgi:hypothetical protein